MHLFLIGYRATGKSTVARQLSRRLQLAFIDLDWEVAQKAGTSIKTIFAQRGENEFRRLESEALTRVIGLPPAIISLGGGAVLKEKNRSLLKKNGRVVWLRADVETILHRMQHDQESATNRPALTHWPPRQEIAQLLKERCPIYAACADYEVQTDHRPIDEVVELIARWWENADNQM